jgi:hypothetical protein
LAPQIRVDVSNRLVSGHHFASWFLQIEHMTSGPALSVTGRIS